MKTLRIVFCLILVMTMINLFAVNRKIVNDLGKVEKQGFIKNPDSLILIGNKTSDSTGNINISPSQIANLVSNITILSGFSSGSHSELKVTPITAYLLLTGTDGGNSVHLALQLLVIDGNLYFQQHGSLMLHICKSAVVCHNCNFYVMGNMIIACKCEIEKNENNSTANCINYSYWLR